MMHELNNFLGTGSLSTISFWGGRWKGRWFKVSDIIDNIL